MWQLLRALAQQGLQKVRTAAQGMVRPSRFLVAQQEIPRDMSRHVEGTQQTEFVQQQTVLCSDLSSRPGYTRQMWAYTSPCSFSCWHHLLGTLKPCALPKHGCGCLQAVSAPHFTAALSCLHQHSNLLEAGLQQICALIWDCSNS